MVQSGYLHYVGLLVLMVVLCPIVWAQSNVPEPILDYAVNKSFAGKTSFIDITEDIDQVIGMSEASVLARFRTSGLGVFTFFSASNDRFPDGEMAFTMVNGQLMCHVRDTDGKVKQVYTAPGNYSDGKWHTGVLTLGSTGTEVYVDGRKIAEGNVPVCFNSVKDLNSMSIGRNVDNKGEPGEWHYEGDIDLVQVYDKALSEEEIVRLSMPTITETHKISLPDGVVKTEPAKVFYPGLDGSRAYRIPSLITTKDNTIIAGIDKRVSHSADSPNNIDAAIRRSTDNGETWQDIQVLIDYPGEGSDGASVIDMSLLQDNGTGTIWLLICHFPGGYGFPQAQPGVGFDANGYKLLYDSAGNEYTLRENGEVFDSANRKTDMVVDEAGDVHRADGTKYGNIYLKGAPLREKGTAFLQIIHSDDDGLTWSKPVDLNTQVKEPWMRFIGTGPGRGIQLTKGEHKGRLVFPIYFTNTRGMQSSAVIYSDDHGATWQRGASPNDGRIWIDKRTLSAETLSNSLAQLTEAQVVELANGDLKMFMRNTSVPRVAVATSKDGGHTWEANVEFDSALLEPYCQLTVISYPDQQDGKDRLIFANPANASARINGVVRLSEDGGKTWPYSKVITPDGYAYSCLTVLPNGEIGLLYEDNVYSGGSGCTIWFTRFNLEWLKYELPVIVERPAQVVDITARGGVFRPGDVIDIQVIFDKPVFVIGTPQLTLVTGGAAKAQVSYTKGSGTDTLVFQYHVPGENYGQLDNLADIDLGGGSITEANGKPVELTLKAGALAPKQIMVEH
ncbi:MAG: exo-alpha-sialidase [Limnochordia bacterium]|jgi:sialidase-1